MTLNLTADPERVKHILITARDELQARGWTQWDYGTIDGPKCVLGAIAWADHGDVAPGPGESAYELDAHYVMRMVLDPNITDWNDTAVRTVEEVTVGLDACVAAVDAEIERRRSVAEVQRTAHLAGIETEVTL